MTAPAHWLLWFPYIWIHNHKQFVDVQIFTLLLIESNSWYSVIKGIVWHFEKYPQAEQCGNVPQNTWQRDLFSCTTREANMTISQNYYLSLKVRLILAQTAHSVMLLWLMASTKPEPQTFTNVVNYYFHMIHDDHKIWGSSGEKVLFLERHKTSCCKIGSPELATKPNSIKGININWLYLETLTFTIKMKCRRNTALYLLSRQLVD